MFKITNKTSTYVFFNFAKANNIIQTTNKMTLRVFLILASPIRNDNNAITLHINYY